MPPSANLVLQPALLEYLQPDVLSEQVFARQAKDDGLGAERSLMHAVLEDALKCFFVHAGSTRRKDKKAWDEVAAWISDEADDYPFSFNAICDTLRIDAAALRDRVMAWERARTANDTSFSEASGMAFEVTSVRKVRGRNRIATAPLLNR